jgi:hypothetical protein
MPEIRPGARRYDYKILETLRHFRGMTTHQAAALCRVKRSVYEILDRLERERKLRRYAWDRSLGAASIQVVQLANDQESCSEIHLQVTEALLWAVGQGWRWTVRHPHSVVHAGALCMPVITADLYDRTAKDALNRIAELPDAEIVYVDPDRRASAWVQHEAARQLGKVLHVPPYYRARRHPNSLYR